MSLSPILASPKAQLQTLPRHSRCIPVLSRIVRTPASTTSQPLVSFGPSRFIVVAAPICAPLPRCTNHHLLCRPLASPIYGPRLIRDAHPLPPAPEQVLHLGVVRKMEVDFDDVTGAVLSPVSGSDAERL
eukprot:5912297-Pleurochrysis_carterae.AAC.1